MTVLKTLVILSALCLRESFQFDASHIPGRYQLDDINPVDYGRWLVNLNVPFFVRVIALADSNLKFAYGNDCQGVSRIPNSRFKTSNMGFHNANKPNYHRLG